MVNRRSFLKKMFLGLTGLSALSLPSYSFENLSINQKKIDLPTKYHPLNIDLQNKKVFIYTEVNVKSLYKTNPHWGVVFKDGKFSEKAILKSYVTPLDFYDALIQIGAKPGNNLTKNSYGEFVKGDELDIIALLQDINKRFSLNAIFYDSTGRGFNIRFGGNRKASIEENTGCITCLESCWIGITSNAAYPTIGSFKRLISPNSHFRGKADVLPATENSPVILVYGLRSK